MSKQRTILKLATAAMVGLLAVNAAAADAKDYPGAVCRPDQSSVPAGHTNGVLQVFSGTIMNTSTTEDLHVSCPFVHDQNNIGSAQIETYDRTAVSSVRCQIFSEIDNASGMTLFASSAEQSGGWPASNNAIQLSFGSVGAGNYNYAQCVIPAKDPAGVAGGVSHVAGFHIVES